MLLHVIHVCRSAEYLSFSMRTEAPVLFITDNEKHIIKCLH